MALLAHKEAGGQIGIPPDEGEDMREIKFRAWDGRGMRFWGFLRAGEFQGIPTESGALEYPQMQYTGLKDKNGREIYEGDVVREKVTYRGEAEDQLYEVVWREGYGEFIFRNLADRDHIAPCFEVREFAEVIGNIYENPELLK